MNFNIEKYKNLNINNFDKVMSLNFFCNIVLSHVILCGMIAVFLMEFFKISNFSILILFCVVFILIWLLWVGITFVKYKLYYNTKKQVYFH
jgi:membrane protein YdbS with pleckstrin-like domain